MDIRMSNIASPMPQIRAKFTNKLGIPLSGCKVYTYEPNSDIPKTTWLDTDKTTENTNPILLDAAGEADIFLDGLYRVVVKDRFGFVVYDVEKTGTHAEWDASFVVDANGKTQQEINDAQVAKNAEFVAKNAEFVAKNAEFVAKNAEFKENFKKIPYVNQMWQGALGAWSSGHALNVDTTQRKQIPIGITHARNGFGSGTTVLHVNGTYEQDAMRIQRTLGNTSTSDHNFVINLSFDEAKHLLGNTCCLAWHMFKGADYASSSVNVKILGSDELEQPILRADGLYSNRNVVISSEDFTIEARSKDNPFSLVFDVPENLTQIAVLFTIKFTNTTALDDDYLEFEGLQLTQSEGYVRALKLKKNDVLEKAMTRYQTTYSYGAPRGVPTEQGAIQVVAVNSNVNWAFVENIKFNPPMLIPPQFMFQSPTSGTESRLLNKDTGANINGLAFNLSDSGVNITNNAAVTAGHRFLCHWTAQIIF